jgi:helix-turn-helix protein
MSWTARVWREFHADNLTLHFAHVLLTLHSYRDHSGRCWPSHETLAARARCCVRTVQRALQQARDLGLVDWTERRFKAGWRWLRTSNLYRLLSPDGPVTAVFRRRATTRQQARGGESLRKQVAQEQGRAGGASRFGDWKPRSTPQWVLAARRLVDIG